MIERGSYVEEARSSNTGELWITTELLLNFDKQDIRNVKSRAFCQLLSTKPMILVVCA